MQAGKTGNKAYFMLASVNHQTLVGDATIHLIGVLRFSVATWDLASGSLFFCLIQVIYVGV